MAHMCSDSRFACIGYAAIVVTLAGATPARVLHLLRVVFYTGAVVSMLWAVYYIATGGSQSASVDLSTGGSRPLAISTSLYCAGALFLALLTVRTAPSRARSLPHLVIAGLGLVGVVLGFGRGVFAAVAIVLAVFLVASKGIRRGVLVGIPLALPLVLLAADLRHAHRAGRCHVVPAPDLGVRRHRTRT